MAEEVKPIEYNEEEKYEAAPVVDVQDEVEEGEAENAVPSED